MDWKCPPRRPPTPPSQENQEEEKEGGADGEKDTFFDFDDETSVGAFTFTPQQRRAEGGGLKGSARRKTTSLDGVLSNMRRHKIIEDNMGEGEKEAK